MRLSKPCRLALVFVALAAAGCGAPPVMTAAELNASYDAALDRTASMAVELPGGDSQARAALGRIQTLFTDPSPETVRAQVPAVYATAAYFNDNLTAIEGSEAIAEYLAHTVANIDGMGLEVLEVTNQGIDYFARWRMTVRSARLNDGEPMVSYGVTQFRFDASGAVLVHRDFWDAGTGLYEHLPGLRGLLRRVRAAVLPD
ncbi:MAG: nuclear transport factor 2 family protein [Gammaproteobacteria bacterium]|nr:nuclear transport factor 2 family protein [Gammaproteobacteria bacterium]